jgi:hypothetical protein
MSTQEQANFEPTDNNVSGGGNTKIIIKMDKMEERTKIYIYILKKKQNRQDRSFDNKWEKK